MTQSMQRPVVLEFDADTGHYTATVPGIPGIVVDAKTEKTALKLVAEAIAMYRDEQGVPDFKGRSSRLTFDTGSSRRDFGHLLRAMAAGWRIARSAEPPEVCPRGSSGCPLRGVS